MKKNLMLFLLAPGVLSATVQAATQSGYQPATVVSVESRETPSNYYAGSNPSDAPLQSAGYFYDIAIQVGCTVYRTSYDTAFNYLPSVFATNHPIQVKLKKHIMHLSLPGDRDVRMSIDGRSGVKTATCVAKN
jgi:hypothetical protein